MCDTYDQANAYSGVLSETVQCKQASIVIGFFTYLLHQAATGYIHFLEQRKGDENTIKGLKGFKLDIEQNSFFFLVLVLFMQILTPVPFGVIMLYLYFFLSFPLVLMGHLKPERWWKLRIVGISLQVVIGLTLLLFVLANPWCRQYFFRYVVAVPPSQ